jgi:hypothetical protein
MKTLAAILVIILFSGIGFNVGNLYEQSHECPRNHFEYETITLTDLETMSLDYDEVIEIQRYQGKILITKATK